MFHLYILHNPTIDKYYIGYTSDLSKRLLEHAKPEHKSKFTRKQLGEWVLVYREMYQIKSDAIKREKQIKSWKSKKMIQGLINIPSRDLFL